MAKRNVEARLKFLHESARVLLISSPSTSAFLEAECTRIAAENEINFPESRRQEVCGACGSILVPGWTMEIDIQDYRPKKLKNKAPSKNTARTTKALVYQCGLCNSKTRVVAGNREPRRKEKQPPTTWKMQNVPAPVAAPETSTGVLRAPQGSSPVQNAAPIATRPASAAEEAATSKIATSNASSKKRAKARKAGGLQAMLAKSKAKTSQSSGFGLDLMDFMKED